MLKNYAIKKIMLSSIALLILTILYFFPKEENSLKIPTTVNLYESYKSVIYLIDKNDYVARTNIINNNKDTIDGIKYLISCLTINSNNQIYLPYGFSPIIPQNTKIIDYHVERVVKAYPAYFDSYKDFNQVREYLNEFDNLYCIGRNGQHRYNNMDHSMETAIVCIDNILNNIKEKDNIWNVNTEEVYHEEKTSEDRKQIIWLFK